MIASLSGTVQAIGASWAVIEVGGVGMQVSCPPETLGQLRLGSATQLATTLVVREDALTLYGFAHATERDLFELVQQAAGVGPRLALAIVSVLDPSHFVQAVGEEDYATLQKVPGVGRKGAQKIVLELKDKVAALGVETVPVPHEAWQEQVRQGLEGLGWSAKDAERACEAVAPLAQEGASLASLMRSALASLAKA